MKKLISFLWFLTTITFFAEANITKQRYSKSAQPTIEKWEVLDISFKAKVGKINPFITNFDALFTAPNGRTQKVPGFYNGNNEWVIRFSAKQEGQWTFTTQSKIKALNARSGQVIVNKNNTKGYKGAVVIPEARPDRFFYENGDPYMLMAFECDWLHALDYHNENGMPKTDRLLEVVKENGFNQIIMNVFTYNISGKGEWAKDEKLVNHPEYEFGGPDDIFPFLGNNENPDYSSLNIDFFKKFDRVIDLMHDRQMVSHLMIYVWNKLVAWPEMYSEADNMYFDYVVKRYQAFPNIMWDISKEALFYGRADDQYILERLERFRKLNDFNRTVSVHDYGFCARHPETVDYISRQTWDYSLYSQMLNDRKRFKNKPIFNIEHGGYEEAHFQVFTGVYTNAEVCLKRNYQCAFAGAYSTYYWQGLSWDVMIHDPEAQPENWYRPKLEYFKYFTDLFTKYHWHKFKPTPGHNSSGYSMADGEGTFLMYVPKEVYMIRAQYLFNKNYKPGKYRWFNTLTGEYTPYKQLPDIRAPFYSPWKDIADAVLIVEQDQNS
ncbi:DUF5060 domain-containing protein [Persicobacter psychrovividus]|uniref:DUF5060 domain-containing protein n=1 Tax=Persicobacter psychrovividus TaxID=387638 RepID=A0ABN6LGM2_9BACT|nr:hypothetical protein PEPS_45780 [Persicobacter psychrovividus]